MEESNGDDQSYIPQVGDDRKPNIGMRFESLEDSYLYYNQYARESGFSARISNIKRNKKTSEVIWKKIVCFKEGQTDEVRWSKEANSDKQRQNRARRDIRSGCMEKISVVKEQTEANIPTCQQMRLFEIEYGGPENVDCTEIDLRNYHKSLREEHMGMDAETFVDFLQSEKDKCLTFFFDYETESDNIFSRCFWADSVSRRAKIVFGDVVVFDTTYNSNKYGLIFAPFVGVNNHSQTILFGCGFLIDERT
ncbi:protein FAR1-RELATED SEQUENCE 5-like [Henckelia pumila]|uniref:protein FAR1-RELATED SEQUENCE 5-like n=1 Tax=Henckelia pumila TaxID=405737 RepID=UPI003C6E4493